MEGEISLDALTVDSCLWLIPSTLILLSCRMVTTAPHLNLYILWQKFPGRHRKGCQENLKFIASLHIDFMSSLMLSHRPQTSQNWNKLKNWKQGVMSRSITGYIIANSQNAYKESQNYQHHFRCWETEMWGCDLHKFSSYRKQSHISWVLVHLCWN